MIRLRLRLVLSLLFSLGVVLTPAHAVFDKLKPKTKPKDDAADSAPRQMAEYKGVKHALGVLDFENQGGLYSQWSLGENLRMMLESALFETSRFVIVERDELGAVVAEQDLAASGRAAAASKVAQTGKIRSARYLASGAVTEASADTAGGEGGITIKGLRLGGSSNKASLVIVVKLIDTTTGQVLASKRVRGQAGGRGVRVGYYNRGVGGDLGGFSKTPLAEAAQDCIDQAVTWIASEMEDFKVEGSVVTVSGEQIVISLGQNFGVTEGQKFAIRKPGETLIDPASGEVLDTSEGETIGQIEAVKVREKVTYCKLLDGVLPERGAAVVLEK